MTTVRLTLDVEVDEEGVGMYREKYPDLAALNEDYVALLTREAIAAWESVDLVIDVRPIREGSA